MLLVLLRIYNYFTLEHLVKPEQSELEYIYFQKKTFLCVPGAGIKAQVCSVVDLLVTTLFQAYAVFYMPADGGPRPGEGALSCGMLFSTLENVTSATPGGKRR